LALRAAQIPAAFTLSTAPRIPSTRAALDSRWKHLSASPAPPAPAAGRAEPLLRAAAAPSGRATSGASENSIRPQPETAIWRFPDERTSDIGFQWAHNARKSFPAETCEEDFLFRNSPCRLSWCIVANGKMEGPMPRFLSRNTLRILGQWIAVIIALEQGFALEIQAVGFGHPYSTRHVVIGWIAVICTASTLYFLLSLGWRSRLV
jgi:hypothetical protein